jgi:hypothetical protein
MVKNMNPVVTPYGLLLDYHPKQNEKIKFQKDTTTNLTSNFTLIWSNRTYL